MRKIICKLSDTDTYSKAGFADVFLNNPRFFKNTLWNKRKKQLQTVPHFFQDEALDLYYISLIVFYADCTGKEVFISRQLDTFFLDRYASAEEDGLGCQ